MGLIREPLEVDFEFDPRPLTKEEKEKISNYIRANKTKNLGVSVQKTSTTKKSKPRKKSLA